MASRKLPALPALEANLGCFFCTTAIAMPDGPPPTPTLADPAFLAVCNVCSDMFASVAQRHHTDPSSLAGDFVRMTRMVSERRRRAEAEDRQEDNDMAEAEAEGDIGDIGDQEGDIGDNADNTECGNDNADGGNDNAEGNNDTQVPGDIGDNAEGNNDTQVAGDIGDNAEGNNDTQVADDIGDIGEGDKCGNDNEGGNDMPRATTTPRSISSASDFDDWGKWKADEQRQRDHFGDGGNDNAEGGNNDELF